MTTTFRQNGFPRTPEDLENRCKNFSETTLDPYQGPRIIIDRFNSPLKAGTSITNRIPNAQIEKIYCREWFYQQNQPPDKSTPFRNDATPNQITVKNKGSNKKLTLFGIEIPNQGGNSTKGRRIDLLGTYDEKLCFIEAKQGNNSDTIAHAVAEAYDYYSHFLHPSNVEKINNNFLTHSIDFLKKIKWSQNSDCYIAILADKTWWNTGQRRNDLKESVKKCKFRNSQLIGLMIETWEIPWNEPNRHIEIDIM